MQLNQQNLAQIAKTIPVPAFDSNTITSGIAHIGVGGFHRAHQAYYIDKLLGTKNNADWGITGVGIREADSKMATIFEAQDNYYTSLVKHPNGELKPEIIGSIIDFKLGTDNPKAVISLLAHHNIKIVSLTITEGGYNFNPTTGEFNYENPDIQHDLKNIDQPKTVFGYLSAALRERQTKGRKGFTLLSCDNIEHNGDVAQKMLMAFAEKQDAELAKWISQEVSFPNSMVDRITPVTTAADITYLQEHYNIEDQWPVTCEPFIQWVVEDNFVNGRPPLEEVGVQFVSDVSPYEKMKLRLLNAGHSVLGILGAIHGHQTINDCMADPIFDAYLKRFMDVEATPVLDAVEGIDLEAYKNSLRERFSNPFIKDSVSRICSESAAKLPKFLIPTLQENLKNDGSIEISTLVLAAWCYYSDTETDFNGNPLEVIDEQRDALHQKAKQTPSNSLAFLEQEAIFGDLARNKKFTSVYERMVLKIYKDEDIYRQMKELI